MNTRQKIKAMAALNFGLVVAIFIAISAHRADQRAAEIQKQAHIDAVMADNRKHAELAMHNRMLEWKWMKEHGRTAQAEAQALQAPFRATLMTPYIGGQSEVVSFMVVVQGQYTQPLGAYALKLLICPADPKGQACTGPEQLSNSQPARPLTNLSFNMSAYPAGTYLAWITLSNSAGMVLFKKRAA